MITISTRDYTTPQLKDLARVCLIRFKEYMLARNVKKTRIASLLVKPTQYAGIYSMQEDISGKR